MTLSAPSESPHQTLALNTPPHTQAIDGADLDTNPEAHSVHCMVDIADCRANGFGLLEKKSDGSYDLKYKLDSAGNTKALEMLDALKAAEGGGRKNVLVHAEGTVGSDGETLSISSIMAGTGEEGHEEPEAGEVMHMGFLVDNFCWDKPGHVAIDGADLDTAPEDHSVHCMADIQDCRDNGFSLLEKKSDGTFMQKYVFDAAGNTKALALLDDLKAKEGADRKNVVVTAMGSVGSDGKTLSLSSLTAAKTSSGAGAETGVGVLTKGLTITRAEVDRDDDEIRVTIKSETNSWIAFGVTTSGGGMSGGGNGADIIVCTTEGAKRYWVTKRAKPTGGVAVSNARCTMMAGMSEMTFTRKLSAGTNEREITPGKTQSFIWAIGADGDTTAFNYHGSRGPVELDIGNLEGGTRSSKTNLWALWCHATFMAIAAGWCWPWGSAIAKVTKNVPGAAPGAWFNAHRMVQVAGWLFGIIGVGFSISYVENDSVHFFESHTIVGIIAFILATLQPFNAAIRPHPTAEGEKKTTARAAWEFVHKTSGWVAVWVGFGAMLSGGLLFLQRADKNDASPGVGVLGLALGMTGFFLFLCYAALSSAVPNNPISRAIVGAKSGYYPPEPAPARAVESVPMQAPQQQSYPEHQAPQQQMYPQQQAPQQIYPQQYTVNAPMGHAPAPVYGQPQAFMR